MIDCNWLRQHLGYSCHPVETVDGGTAMCIQTAHTWADGSIFSFYLIDNGDTILLTDDCESLFYFHAQGLDSRHNIRVLRGRLEDGHIRATLENDGDLCSIGRKSETPYLIADYISAVCTLMRYEREMLTLSQDTAAFSAEVELYLRAWKPKAKLISNPKIKGISGRSHTFDFALDKELILAVSPSPQAVGAAMRKLGDVKMTENGQELMVVVDDRSGDLFATQKVNEEIAILSSLVKAVPFSSLVKAAGRTTAHC